MQGWGWGWNDPNGYLRASGREMLAHADRVGWALYPEERAMLERVGDTEIYLETPLSEIDIVQFGAAIEKFRFKAEGRKREPMVPDDYPRKTPKQKNRKDRDNGRDRRYR